MQEKYDKSLYKIHKKYIKRIILIKSHLDSRRTGMDDGKELFRCQTYALAAFLLTGFIRLTEIHSFFASFGSYK